MDEIRPVVPAMRWVFRVGAALVALAGVQLFFLTDHTDTFFAWTIASGLSAAFLGAFYFTALALAASSAAQTAWANARVGVLGVFWFVTFTLIATFRDLDKFHFHEGVVPRGAAWLWTLIYVAAPIGVALAFVEQMRSSGVDPPRLAPLPTWFRAVLAAESAVILFVSLVFLFGSGPAWWPWTLTPLVAHAMGAWLIGLGLVLASGVFEDDWIRIQQASIACLVLGVLQIVAVARYWDLATGSLRTVYLAFLGLLVATGAVGTAYARVSSQPITSAALRSGGNTG